MLSKSSASILHILAPSFNLSGFEHFFNAQKCLIVEDFFHFSINLLQFEFNSKKPGNLHEIVK